MPACSYAKMIFFVFVSCANDTQYSHLEIRFHNLIGHTLLIIMCEAIGYNNIFLLVFLFSCYSSAFYTIFFFQLFRYFILLNDVRA